ncbi:hypothetical protein GOBAR_DD18671 [Gossypium barbadense]|nr:hypothetical protein GOBAR_DD18671 [Gossypium barbadense]
MLIIVSLFKSNISSPSATPRSMNKDDDDLGGPHEEDPDNRAQTSDQLDLNVEVGIEFESDENAYRFYNKYARLSGFSVRKDWVNRSKIHGQVVSRKFTCSKEGYRRKDQRDVIVKKHRKETRTGCLAHMNITRKPNGKYRLSHFEANHNHDNINPYNGHALQLQKDLCFVHVPETEQPNNLETQNPAFDLTSKILVRESLECLPMDYFNHLRSERVRDMKEGEAGESLSNKLRSYLNDGQDVLQFFKHFERVMDEQRHKEIKATHKMSHCKPELMGNVILLKHASEIYTPKAFEVFQHEYEECLNVVANQCSQNGYLSEYKVNTFGKSQEYIVTFDSSDDLVICCCMKFEYVGFLCSHALRVLDHRNIKVVPSRYILKRWMKDARIGCAQDDSDFIIQENPKLVAASRYRDMCRSILNLSARAAESYDAFHFASGQLNETIEGVEKILAQKAEDAQVIASSSSAATAPDSENVEIFLDGNAIDDQEKSCRTQSKKENEATEPHRHK